MREAPAWIMPTREEDPPQGGAAASDAPATTKSKQRFLVPELHTLLTEKLGVVFQAVHTRRHTPKRDSRWTISTTLPPSTLPKLRVCPPGTHRGEQHDNVPVQ